jgi:hypothetical protein
MDFIADIQREISRVSFERPKDIDIKVGSLPSFVAAIEELAGMRKAEPKTVVEATFCGVKVMEDSRVSADMAVIMHGNEIINIVRFK